MHLCVKACSWRLRKSLVSLTNFVLKPIKIDFTLLKLKDLFWFNQFQVFSGRWIVINFISFLLTATSLCFYRLDSNSQTNHSCRFTFTLAIHSSRRTSSLRSLTSSNHIIHCYTTEWRETKARTTYKQRGRGSLFPIYCNCNFLI